MFGGSHATVIPNSSSSLRTARVQCGPQLSHIKRRFRACLARMRSVLQCGGELATEHWQWISSVAMDQQCGSGSVPVLIPALRLAP